MNENVQNVTDLPVPKKNHFNKKKVAAGAAIGVFALGLLLVIDDQVKKFNRDKVEKHDETPTD